MFRFSSSTASICCVLLAFSFVVKGHHSHHKKRCPVTAITSSKPEDILAAQRGAISKILTIPKKNSTDILWKNYKTCIEEMSNGNSTDALRLVGLSVMTLSSYLPFLDQKPNGCITAQVINATLSCERDNDRLPMLEAVKNMVSLFSMSLKQMDMNGRRASGCLHHKEQKTASPFTEGKVSACWGDGFVYCIEYIWKWHGAALPKDFRDVIMDMYKSNTYLHKLTALITTYGLLPVVTKVYSKWNIQEAIEVINLQNAPKIPRHCCKTALANMDKLQKSSEDQQNDLLQIEIDNYALEDACCASLVQ